MGYEFIFRYSVNKLDESTYDEIVNNMEIFHEGINDGIAGMHIPDGYELASHSLNLIGTHLVLTLIFQRPRRY